MLTRSLALVLSVSVAGVAVSVVAADGLDGVALVRSTEAAYRALDRGAAITTSPEEPLRLVVRRGGRVVADHGLARSETAETERDADGILVRRERVRRDEAWVTADGDAAVIARTRLVVERPMDDEAGPIRVSDGEVEIVWIDPEHPGGRWSERFGDGRTLGSVRLVESGAGVAIATVSDDDAEFRVYDRDGRSLAIQGGLLPTSPDVRTAPDADVLVADLAYRPATSGFADRTLLPDARPDRALLVVDLDTGHAWSYPWSYGSDVEPSSWELAPDGTLRVVTPGTVFRYAADGRPLGGKRRR